MFQVGDRVMYSEEFFKNPFTDISWKNDTGTVIHIGPFDLAVMWDSPRHQYHTCGLPNCEDNYGYWCDQSWLKLISESEAPDIDEDGWLEVLCQ